MPYYNHAILKYNFCHTLRSDVYFKLRELNKYYFYRHIFKYFNDDFIYNKMQFYRL